MISLGGFNRVFINKYTECTVKKPRAIVWVHRVAPTSPRLGLRTRRCYSDRKTCLNRTCDLLSKDTASMSHSCHLPICCLGSHWPNSIRSQGRSPNLASWEWRREHRGVESWHGEADGLNLARRNLHRTPKYLAYYLVTQSGFWDFFFLLSKETTLQRSVPPLIADSTEQ